MITPIDINYDKWLQLRIQCEQFVNKNQLHSNQFCFTNTDDNNDPSQGCGSLVWKHNLNNEEQTKVKRDIIYQEEDFTKFNSEYVGTPVHDIYLWMTERYRIGRFRLMLVKPKVCYTWHRDLNQRLHVPVSTHENAYMMFKDLKAKHMPHGSAYLTDTTEHHTAMNLGERNRIHLVGVVL